MYWLTPEQRAVFLANHWPKYREKAMKAITAGTHSEEDLLNMIIRGDVHFFPLKDSVVISEFVEYPQCRTLRVFITAGDLDELLAFDEVLTQFAIDNGCKFMELGAGRRGWERVLKDYGYETVCPMMVKHLTTEVDEDGRG